MRPIIVAFALLIGSLPAAADPPSMETLYHYRAVITEVHDGASVSADIDLGFSVWRHGEKFGLARIDAPDPSGATQAAGEASRDFLKNLIEGKQVLIHSIVDPNQEGRYLVEIWLGDVSVNDQLVAEGHAVQTDD